MFGVTAQNGHRSLKWKNFVRLPQAKLLGDFKEASQIRTIPCCEYYALLHKMATRVLNRKKNVWLSQVNSWWDLHAAVQSLEYSHAWET
jgi:hypothetical protein